MNLQIDVKPILAILVPRPTIRALRKQKPLKRLWYLQKASITTNVTLIFFAERSVDYNNVTVNGTYYDEHTKQWQMRTVPFPRVLYKRAAATQKFNNFITAHGIRTMNLYPFNKWLVYKALNNVPKLNKHLPLTVLYQERTDIVNMLKTWDTLYLKPCRGRKGKQIMRVNKLHDRSYHYSYYSLASSSAIARQVSSLEKLLVVVESFFGQKSFIVQQGIDVLTVEDKNVDLRVEVQRVGKNELDIIAILARLGVAKSPITTHASSYLLNRFLHEHLGYTSDQSNEIYAAIADLVTKLYPVIESAFGSYAELGIDLALDKAGELWFIECNSQSAKISLFNAASDEAIQRSYSNLMRYAKLLIKDSQNKRILSNST